MGKPGAAVCCCFNPLKREVEALVEFPNYGPPPGCSIVKPFPSLLQPRWLKCWSNVGQSKPHGHSLLLRVYLSTGRHPLTCVTHSVVNILLKIKQKLEFLPLNTKELTQNPVWFLRSDLLQKQNSRFENKCICCCFCAPSCVKRALKLKI